MDIETQITMHLQQLNAALDTVDELWPDWQALSAAQRATVRQVAAELEEHFCWVLTYDDLGLVRGEHAAELHRVRVRFMRNVTRSKLLLDSPEADPELPSARRFGSIRERHAELADSSVPFPVDHLGQLIVHDGMPYAPGHVPRGKALNWDEVEAFAIIDDAAIADAANWWRERADPEFRNLLDARSMHDTDED